MPERLFYLILLTAALIAVVHTAMTDTEYIEMNSRGHLFCKHNVTTEDLFYSVKWFKSSRDDVFENGAPAVVSWDGTSQPYTTGNYNIDTAFSLVIFNTSIQDEGVYQCYRTLPEEPYEMMHNVKLKVYALPSKAPLIQRVNDTFINCSVDRVYPLLYPYVEFKHEKYAVGNEDGTYNTSVSGSPQGIRGESKAVLCSFPYFNYSEVSSLILQPTAAVTFGNADEPQPGTLTGSTITMEPSNQGSKNTFLQPVIISMPIFATIIAVIILLLILLLYRRKHKKRILQVTATSALEECNGMLGTSRL